MNLFDPSRHETLLEIPWDEAQVRQAIHDIAVDTEAHFDAEHLWLAHPLDYDPGPPETPEKTLYLGAAGILWTLRYLDRCGLIPLRLDYSSRFRAVYDAYCKRPDTGEVVPSWFLGEVGVALITWRVSPSAALADRLFEVIRANLRNPTREALWGAPGTMLGALYMLEWTGAARWKDLYLENVQQVWDEWVYEPEYGCHLWTQELYGSVVKLLGAGHGFVGNVYALLRGQSLLSETQRQTLYARTLEVLQATVLRDGDCANWPPGVGPARPGRPAVLVQWCHGAPGIVTSLNDVPKGAEPALDALLLAAGELTWKAGPLTKGPNLCHGTAGNGYAFLKLYRRTGDAKWLTRARAFAMHALDQSTRALAQYGRRRYSLMTGELGLAVYLWHCISGEDKLPGLDVL